MLIKFALVGNIVPLLFFRRAEDGWRRPVSHLLAACSTYPLLGRGRRHRRTLVFRQEGALPLWTRHLCPDGAPFCTEATIRKALSIRGVSTRSIVGALILHPQGGTSGRRVGQFEGHVHLSLPLEPPLAGADYRASSGLSSDGRARSRGQQATLPPSRDSHHGSKTF